MATKAYYIPNGPLNLAPLFPTINFSQVAEYYIQLIDDLDIVIASSPMNQLCGCDNPDDNDCIRIFFLNYVGAVDGITFKKKEIDHEAKSTTYQRQLSHPLVKSEHSTSRYNVKSNDAYRVVSVDYQESDMDWINELLDSPVAWMQTKARQGQPAAFIPIVIADQKSRTFKENDRYVYEVEVEFTLSHEKFVIRN